MQEPLAISQVSISSFEKALKDQFEVWLLEEKRLKDENHKSIDEKPRKLRCFDVYINLRASIALQYSMVF